MKKEESLQTSVCNFIRLQYPNVVFTSEMSGIRLTIGQAAIAKKQRSGRGLPDLIIFEPKGRYCGMLLELKVITPYKKNGQLKADKHLHEQVAMMRKLYEKGYYVNFGIGFDDCTKLIKMYMAL